MQVSKGRKMIEVVCDNPKCRKTYLKPLSEYKRNVAKQRESFCSRNCSGAIHLERNIGDKRFDISIFAGNKHGIKRSPFARYIRLAEKRAYEVELTEQYLERIWNEQNGKCVYTGLQLQHIKYDRANDKIWSASLDRIDSAEGYVEGNVQFVSIAVNYMKNTMTHEQTIELCKHIAKHWN